MDFDEAKEKICWLEAEVMELREENGQLHQTCESFAWTTSDREKEKLLLEEEMDHWYGCFVETDLQLKDLEEGYVQLQEELRKALSEEHRRLRDRFAAIMQVVRREEGLVEEGQAVSVDERYGYLIASLWQQVREQTGFEYRDVEVFGEMLEELLKQQMLSEEMIISRQEALAACNEYREAECSPFARFVLEAGLDGADRHELAIGFCDNWQRWQRQLRMVRHETHLRFRSGSLAGQERLEVFFEAKGINGDVLSLEDFCLLWDRHPGEFQVNGSAGGAS